MKHLKLFEEYKVDNFTEQDIIDTIEHDGSIKVFSIKGLPNHNDDDYVKPIDIDGDSIIVYVGNRQYRTNLRFVTTLQYSNMNESIEFNSDDVISSNNKPITFYHGGSFTSGEFRGMAWFTIRKTDANYYAKQTHGVLTKANLIVRNPLYSGNIEHLNIKITDDIIESAKKRDILYSIKTNSDGIIEFIETNNAVLIAEDIGRDGVIEMRNGEITDVVVFSDEQIIKL